MAHVRPWVRRIAAAGAAAGAMAAAAADGAAAACTASTPAGASYTDNASDSERGLAPEITFVDATLGTRCDLVVLPSLGDRSPTAGLIRDETVATYIDVDGDSATGSPRWGGADRVVLVVGRRGPDLPPLLGTWTGAGFSFAAGIALPVVAAGGFEVTLDQLGVSAPTTLGLRVATTWTGLRDTYDDLAPKRAGAALTVPVTFATDGSGGPAATPAPSGPGPAPCLVPKVRRLTLAQARAMLSRAGCRARVVRVASGLKPGRVSSTLPAAGTWTIRTVVVNVARS